jgi:hypothetical protein
MMIYNSIIKEEILQKIPIHSVYYKEEWFEDWFNLVFGWHFEHYANDYSFSTYKEQLDIVLNLSDDTWKHPNFIDEFGEWKEDLENEDDPDKFTTYPIYLCKKFLEEKDLNSKFLCDYLSERITII